MHSWTLYHIRSWLFSVHNTHSIKTSLHQAFWPKLMNSITPEFRNDQKSLCVNKRLTPPTINCKLKQPTTWVQKTQKTSPQHQQILSNKYRVLPLFMWQWSADASRGVAYHIHLVQQVIVLILSMELANCSGAFYLCIQAKFSWLSDASSSQPKSVGIISNGYLPNRKITSHSVSFSNVFVIIRIVDQQRNSSPK